MLLPGSQAKAVLQWTVEEGYGIQQMTKSPEAAASMSEQTVRCAQCEKCQKKKKKKKKMMAGPGGKIKDKTRYMLS